MKILGFDILVRDIGTPLNMALPIILSPLSARGLIYLAEISIVFHPIDFVYSSDLSNPSIHLYLFHLTINICPPAHPLWMQIVLATFVQKRIQNKIIYQMIIIIFFISNFLLN